MKEFLRVWLTMWHEWRAAVWLARSKRHIRDDHQLLLLPRHVRVPRQALRRARAAVRGAVMTTNRTGFRYRQAYAMLQKKVAIGDLPRATYKFIIGLERVTPRVQGASLDAAEQHTLDSIIRACTYTRIANARRAA
jgi:hypothetical protein